jgi:hypothetical protein
MLTSSHLGVRMQLEPVDVRPEALRGFAQQLLGGQDGMPHGEAPLDEGVEARVVRSSAKELQEVLQGLGGDLQ